MKVIIISDSHGNLDNVRKIMEKEKDVDRVIHLGDLIGQDEQLKMICDCPIYGQRIQCPILWRLEKIKFLLHTGIILAWILE